MAKRKLTYADELRIPTQRDALMNAIRRDKFPTEVRQAAARKYAEARGIKYSSALRTIERYTTTAGQKRGVTKPNPDIFQSIIDAERETASQDDGWLEIMVDPPGAELYHSFEVISRHSSAQAAMNEAKMEANGYQYPMGSEPRLWEVTSSRASLFREEAAYDSYLDEDVVYHIPNSTGYEVRRLMWVPRH
jgi:hypothetical protein